MKKNEPRIVVKNSYFRATVPKSFRANFQCSKFLDALAIVCEFKRKKEIILLLAWDRYSKGLSTQRDSYLRSLTEASESPRIETGQQVRDGFRFDHQLEDTVRTWKGGVVETQSLNGIFSDFEVITENQQLVIYIRYFTEGSIAEALPGLNELLTNVEVSDPTLWDVTLGVETNPST